MKNSKINYIKNSSLLALFLLFNVSCDRDLSEDATLSTYSKNGEVFIDAFSAGLGYGAFGGSKYSAFTVDSEVKYAGTSSMRFDVPSVGDPDGAYAGGVFIDGSGRNLTDFDALTFWVKASHAATLNEVGFGTDFGLNKYKVAFQNVPIDTNWKKIIIPIPDASKLIQEKGMFWYSEGPENGLGYTFWIDNVRYEKLGTIAHGQASIMNGNTASETTFVGVTSQVDGVIATFNMPNGINQSITISPAYLNFISSNPAVATVNSSGVITSLSAGTTIITATINGTPTTGSLTINCAGVFTHSPVPTLNQANVISIFSNAYTNVPVNYYNGYWAPWQTTLSNDFSVQGDNVLNYTVFNFVGIEFSSPTINATSMTHFHLDAFIPGTIAPGRQLRVIVVDFGADGVYGGGDDTRHSTTFTAPFLVSQNWMSIEIPFSAMPSLLSRSHLAQIILEGGDNSVIYADNIYFHN
ncbi:MAG: glycosyl hydrolase family 16 [Flavobacterium sp.]